MLKASSGVIFLSAMAFSVAVSANASESYVNYPALKGGACKSYAFRD